MNPAPQAAPPRAAKEAEDSGSTSADAAFDPFRAAFPDPYRILGLSLLPLSLGRYRLLKRFGCAFVAEGVARAEAGDLLLGVVICSMRCQGFLDFLEAKNFRRQISRWGRRVSPFPWIGYLPWIGKAWRDRYSFNLLEKLNLFKRYIEEAQTVPNYISTSAGDRQSKSHWSDNVEIVLRSELGWTREEIEEAPLSKALNDYFNHAERQGLVVILTDDDLQAAEANAAALERAAAHLATFNPS